MKTAMMLVVLLGGGVVQAGEVWFGDRSMRGQPSDKVVVIGPSTRIDRYTKAKKDAFEPVDATVIEKMKDEVLIDLPWRLVGTNNTRDVRPMKLVFTKVGTRDVVREIPVESEEVPLTNGFGKKSIGYHGWVTLSIADFAFLDAELEIHLVHEGYTFTDKWKKEYYAKVLKAK